MNDDKVLRKLEVLEEYCETKVPDFSLPKKFSFNWFVSWESSSLGLEKISKSLGSIRSDGYLRGRVNRALSESETVRQAVEELDVSTEREYKKLKLENEQLKRQKSHLAQSVYELMLEVEELRSRLGVQQAQFADKQKIKQWASSDG